MSLHSSPIQSNNNVKHQLNNNLWKLMSYLSQRANVRGIKDIIIGIVEYKVSKQRAPHAHVVKHSPV